MRTAFVLPSCNYNIVLNKEELQALLETGHLTVIVSKTPCKTLRYYWNEGNNDFIKAGKRDIYNDLRFHLDEPVEDCESGDWPVQFLNISVKE